MTGTNNRSYLRVEEDKADPKVCVELNLQEHILEWKKDVTAINASLLCPEQVEKIVVVYHEFWRARFQHLKLSKIAFFFFFNIIAPALWQTGLRTALNGFSFFPYMCRSMMMMIILLCFIFHVTEIELCGWLCDGYHEIRVIRLDGIYFLKFFCTNWRRNWLYQEDHARPYPVERFLSGVAWGEKTECSRPNNCNTTYMFG